MKRLLAVLVVLALGLSGCVSPEPSDDEAEAQPQVQIVDDRPDTTFGEVETGPSVGPDLDATTAAAPELIEGEWWRIRYSNLFTGGDVEFVRVVANATADNYIFGMPHSGWFKEAVAYHAPAFGDVNRDLSYMTHNVLFEPVRFPLEEGNTWETAFAATPMVAEVTEADEYTATVVFSAPENDDPTFTLMEALGLAVSGEQMRIKYDARMHEVVRMESGIGLWEVIDHGYDFEGWVTVPRGMTTPIDYGVLGPVSDAHSPVLPREIEVEGGYNRLTLMQLIVPITPGSYTVRTTAPDGTAFETTSMASDQMVIEFYEAKDPDGFWYGEDIIGGAAATYHMGLAYHQFDIKLPDQLRRADHSHEVIR